jgi:hypothetical protein
LVLPTAVTNAPSSWLPRGFAARILGENTLTWFDAQGQPMGKTTSLEFVGQMQMAGTLAQGASAIPFVYENYETKSLQLYWNGSSTKIVDVKNLFHLTSAPGQPILAYTVIDYVGQGNPPIYRLYVTTLQAMPTASPALIVTNTESYVPYPLAVCAERGQPQGVWYTNELYGIGDVAFAPRQGLYYLDLNSRASTEVLSRTAAALSLSVDQTWVAYRPERKGPFTIRNLTTGQEHRFPLLNVSNFGAGDVFFSPDNQYVAWVEVGGEWGRTEYGTTRVASTSGRLIADLPDWSLIRAIGRPTLRVRPAGWLDAQTLLLTMGTLHSPFLARINYDGTKPAYLAPGNLVGLLYQ